MKVDIGSDHRMVRVIVEINKKLKRLKKNPKTNEQKNMHRFLQICYQIYYNQTVPRRTVQQSPDTEEIPQFTEEVERAIKRMMTQSPCNA